uniref:Secreted protein n=1 Tax=Trichuris muris TaxID=70415 RepID=A0A5S6QB71_TRIMR
MKAIKRQCTFVHGVSALLILLFDLTTTIAALDKSNWIPVYPLIPLGQEVKHKSTAVPHEPYTESSVWEDRRPITHERLEVTQEYQEVTHESLELGSEYTTPVVLHGNVRSTSLDDFYAQFPQQEISYAQSSGTEQECQLHRDCYASREPKEWCHLIEQTQYSSRGCFCDKALGKCVIDRIKSGRLEWTYCTLMNADPCEIR